MKVSLSVLVLVVVTVVGLSGCGKGDPQPLSTQRKARFYEAATARLRDVYPQYRDIYITAFDSATGVVITPITDSTYATVLGRFEGADDKGLMKDGHFEIQVKDSAGQVIAVDHEYDRITLDGKDMGLRKW